MPSAAAVELLQSPTCADLRFWFLIHLFVLEVNAKPLDTFFFLWISNPVNVLRRLSMFVRHGYPDLPGRVWDARAGHPPET